jgi:Flp pilus assembly protein TadG
MLKRFLRDRRGNITILSAVMMTSLVGVAGLVADYGNGLFNRLEDQRIADTAAVAGATVYNETSSQSAMNTAVTNVASLNGLSNGTISASLVNSPTGDGNQAVQVTVNSHTNLTFARLLQPAMSTLPVQASSFAEMKSGAAGCIIALSTSGTGVTLSGGTAVTANSCAVVSNNTVTSPCGTSITTTNVAYKSSYSECTTPNSITAPAGKTLTITQTTTTDPLAGTSEVLGQTGRLSTVAALTSPSGPSGGAVSGTALSFPYGTSSTITSALTAQGCSSTYASGVWTVTCPSGGTYSFGAVTVGGGVTVNFSTASSAATTFNFNGQVCDSGTALHFGNGTFNIIGGVASGGGSTTSFGYGTFNIGKSTSTSCQSSSTGYSIYNTGSIMTFGSSTSASTFVLAGAVYDSGGETLVLGAGCTNGGSACTQTSSSNTFTSPTGNSFNIGSVSSTGSCNTSDSFCMGGGATTYFGDASGSGHLFQMAGNIDVTSGGGSCLWIGAATNHDVNGYFATAGGSTLGSGVYTVTKYVSLGGSSGGDVSCGGSTVGLSASNVTFVIGGNSLYTSGTCSSSSPCAFDIANGYGHVTITAPASGNTEGLAVIGPTGSSSTGWAVLAGGSSDTSISGAFYFPYTPVSMSGAAGLGDSGGCLELVGSQVTLSGGSALASSCNIPGVGSSGSSGMVSLVQ